MSSQWICASPVQNLRNVEQRLPRDLENDAAS